MLATFVQKALARAAGLPQVAVGQIVDVQPDVVLSHDNTAAIARLFRSLGRTHVQHPERLAVTLDHAVPAPSADHAQNHAEVRRFVAEQNITHFFDAGRGICHQVLSEEALVLPGQMILGADSHTTHFGWLGAFGAGIGRSEVAALWATGALWLRVPETIRVDLVGALPPGVTAKDLGLWLLKLLGPEAGIYRAVEIGGPGLRTLSLESRMVLPNLLAEAGAKSAYLEPDDAVFAWLNARLAARGQQINLADAMYPDPDASYIVRHVLDLATLEPLVAAPHNPANVLPLSQFGSVRVDQAFIGTCTNGRLEDLAAAAAVLRASDGQVQRIAAGTRLLVIPASSQVMQDALAAGYIATFVAAGAMIGTPGCGPCMGNHFGVPAAGETVISSANRNFRGRMGNRESSIYLASPMVVAASAVLGRIAHPNELASFPASVNGHAALTLPQPIPTAAAPITAPLDLPSGSHTPHHAGRAWVYGDDVNTDVIFPGKYTYTIKQEAEMARHALEDLDPEFAAAVQSGDILVGGRNWGCGSSREQAVTCLRAAGVRVLIAASFARIYFRNVINNGLLPIVCPQAVAAIQPGERVSVDLTRYTVQCAAGEFAFAPFSPSVAAILAAGGLLPMLIVQEQA